MGNCFSCPKKLKPEIAPFDSDKPQPQPQPQPLLLRPKPSAKPHPPPLPAVKLYGSASSSLTAYVRFALLYKCVSPRFIVSESSTVLQIDSETVSGGRETLLRFVETKFPRPPFTAAMISGGGEDEYEWEETTPVIVRVTRLQHKSVRWHLERVVRWADDLAKRGGKKAVDPSMGTPRMEVRKFGKSYSQLLDVMLEHAQMEERVVFPVLERADRGLCKAANEEHARDLPIMNGIKEDIKSIGVLDSGSPIYQEALYNLSSRLKSLRGRCKEHFQEEERDVLPLIEATELSKEQEKRILVQCVNMMQGTHSHLFNFLLEGLLPQEAIQYLDMINDAVTKNQLSSCFI